MALMQCHFFSETLGLSTSMHAIIPQNTTTGQIGMESRAASRRHPVLFLLHGLSDDDSIWLRRTSIERYAASLGLAVIMPQVHRSFYTDMEYGGKYWTFISEELPALARSFFPLSERREDTFVAGLSMGGYGAFKLGLRRPDLFAAAASLSGALDISGHFVSEGIEEDRRLIWGERPVAGSDDDLLALLQSLESTEGPKPKLYQYCGTEDFLYQDNLTFLAACRQTSLELTYEEGPGGHDWGLWDQYIQNVLNWLPLSQPT
ncbi:putative esterase [Paenibacillus algicola]|uniref:Putative esterase n=1 Tax=Paenibacillus algicola TaxID=2565926 RepID=A0A4P8XRR7_9BACL|nr:alpha/beta hydrolase family protein [Paenibacillus algicola]QCT04541.1 putative esterase [Paenibacillus algicola]